MKKGHKEALYGEREKTKTNKGQGSVSRIVRRDGAIVGPEKGTIWSQNKHGDQLRDS